MTVRVVSFVGFLICLVEAQQYLRSRKKNHATTQRRVEWIYNQQRICNNVWAAYDDFEIPDDLSKDDTEDRLLEGDVCFNGTTYEREHCLDPPDCSSVRDFPWPLKLCLNRIPISNQENDGEEEDKFYVAVMKCIPIWENCDKCMCGRIYNNPRRCVSNKQSPDDDRVFLDCDNVSNFLLDAEQKADGSQCSEYGELSGYNNSNNGTACFGSCNNTWDLYWRELSLCQRENFEILGYNEEVWEDLLTPSIMKETCFDTIDSEIKEAALNLCYDDIKWNNESGASC